MEVTQAKRPTAKIIMRPIFCFFGNFRDLITGIGSANIMRSVAMLTEALVNQMAVKLKQ